LEQTYKTKFEGELYNLMDAHKIDFEDLFYILEDRFNREAANQDHPLVVGLLKAIAEHCGEAGFAWYASWK
jgi:hypothetical protein